MPKQYRRNAPIVIWDYNKQKLDSEWGEFYTNYPNEFLYFCMKELNPAQFKVFMFLTTVAYGGFLLHKDTAIERTGLNSTTYYRARKELEEMNWISIIDKPKPKIVLNSAEIRKQYLEHETEPEDREVEEDREFYF